MVHSDPQMTDNINLAVPRDNVGFVWQRNKLIGEKAGSKGNGMVSNGRIAACTFNGLYDNLVVYDYEGNRLWSSKGMLNALAVSSSPMISEDNKIIACDNKSLMMVHVDTDESWVKWITEIPQKSLGLLIPFSPTIIEGETVILPTKNGPVYAFDVDTGRLLATKYLGRNKSEGPMFFSTINSACVHNRRVYISAESSKKKDVPKGRLYAIDVNHTADNPDEVLMEAWYYPYTGRSQASPLFIDDTIYFDGYNMGWRFGNHPKIYALRDERDQYQVIEREYRNRTLFSFSKDPHGGFWFEDTPGKKLVRFIKKDGELCKSEEIRVNDIVPNLFGNYRPLSCMTICDDNRPVLLISVITLFFGKYIVAVDLENDNKVLWRVKTDNIGINYAGGQYTILKRDTDPSNNRILYGAYWGGVVALGEIE
jgi:outer membrane protein assembly factor BamB